MTHSVQTTLAVLTLAAGVALAADIFTLDDGTTARLVVTDTGATKVVADDAARPALEVSSITNGFLPPRMTLAQRDAIGSPAAGLMVYNTDTGTIDYYDGVAAAWISLGSATPPSFDGNNFRLRFTLHYSARAGINTAYTANMGAFTDGNLASSNGALDGVGFQLYTDTSNNSWLAGITVSGGVATWRHTLTNQPVGATWFCDVTRAGDSLRWRTYADATYTDPPLTDSGAVTVAGISPNLRDLALMNAAETLNNGPSRYVEGWVDSVDIDLGAFVVEFDVDDWTDNDSATVGINTASSRLDFRAERTIAPDNDNSYWSIQ